MTKYVFDAYAWIEYFIGNKRGNEVKVILEDPLNEIFTPVIVIAEVCAKARKENFDYDEAHRIIISMSKVEPMNSILAKEAGVFRQNMRKKIENFGIIDAIVLLTARELGAKVLSGDYHLKGFPETYFLG